IDFRDLAGREVFDEELRLVALAADEGELLAVRRWRGPDRAAGAADDRRDFAVGEVVALDLEEAGVRVLWVLGRCARRGVARVVDAGAVRGEGGLAQFLLQFLARALDEEHAVAAADVIEPDLAGAERALGREVLARGDVLAVAAPHGLVQQAECFLAELALV